MKNNAGNLNLWVFIAIILYGLVLYFAPLQSKTFYFDDYSSIKNNEVIRQIDIPAIFNAFNTRSLVGLSFALNYKWCALDATGYRCINLLIHCFNAFLVYLLVKATFSYRFKWPAFFASMLFLCHPIQTEPVNFITQRFMLLGTFFYLASLCFYVKSRLMQNSVIASEAKQFFCYICSLIAAVAAMFCKEFVVTLPFMIALYEFYFLGHFNETLWRRCRRLIPFFIIALIVPLLLLRTPREAIGVANITQKVGNHIDITRARGSIGRKQYFLTELNVVCTYARLLVFPVNQNFDYDYPVSYQLDKKTVLCGVFLLCLLALAVVTFRSYRIISFSILWFFIALSVESSFIPIGHVIAEYRLYLASVGFVFLVMNLIYIRGQTDVKKLNMIAAALIIGCSILTYQRNKVWENEIALWNDVIAKSPHKASAYNNRGFIFFQQGNLAQAIADTTKAIEIDPNYAGAYNSRGFMHDAQGDFALALSDYNQAIKIDPNYALAYNNRGNAYFHQNNFSQALADYTKAIEINPNFSQAHNNRGLIYKKQNNFTQAIADYTKAIALNPNYADAYNNRGNAYLYQNNLSQAIRDYSKAIEINPGHVQARTNLMNVYRQLRQIRP